ncbi:MAG: serine protease [Candidatus Izemoplasmatales bacterium]|nr:serine protease [Candidatus Izemoplasmatales bacterium]
MKKIPLLLLAVSVIFVTVRAEEKNPQPDAETKDIQSVVKVFSVYSSPNYYQPWQNFQQRIKTGSGCVISGNKIITNAHITADQTFLMVRKQGDPKKYTARLIASGHECDLAILTVDEPGFFKDLPPMKLDELPQLQDTVHVLGYPVGGDNISVTEGVVSRIEPVLYNHSDKHLLAIQIDAAINPGNSGGPVINENGKIVGIAFQGLSQAQNVGYVIPVPVIRHFLKDLEDGKFDGYPELNFNMVNMENTDIRKWAKMDDSQSGVMISHLPPLDEKRNIFKVNDVILSIDGVNISNDGTVPFRANEVIYFENLIWEKFIGDKCNFKILRDGKPMDIEYTLGPSESLVRMRTFDKLPSYYIIGGLLFVPLNQNYLDSWNDEWKAPRMLLNYLYYGEITKKRDEVAVLSEVLADDVNMGYQQITYISVDSINGVKVKNLKHLIELIENSKERFIDIKLENKGRVVMELSKMKEATPRILERYRIPTDRSNDLTPQPVKQP